MANKKTQRDFYNDIIALATANDRADIAEFAAGRIEALDNKIAHKKATKTQEENVNRKAVILEVLADTEVGLTVTEIIKTNTFGEDVSNQRVTALLRQLIEEGKVVRVADKKVSRFKLA